MQGPECIFAGQDSSYQVSLVAMRRGTLAVLTCSLLLAGPLSAQTPSLNARGFAPPMDPQASFSLEPTSTPGSFNYSAGLLSSYAYRLVRFEDASGGTQAIPIRHQLSYDVLFNLGLGRRWAFGLALPVVAYQSGDQRADVSWRPPKSALGDPTLELKTVLVPKGELGGLGLASYARVFAPLGSDESSVGTGDFTAQLGVRGELDLILAGVRASVGYAFRERRHVWLGDEFGNYVPWAVGVVLKPQAFGWDKQGRSQWFLEARGELATTPSFGARRSSPAALAVGTRYQLGRDFSAITGIELPLDGAVGAPSLRAVLGLSWAPRFLDADGDGIPDDADDCPEGMPEDRDGFEDDDGCPEDDNDGDGVADAEDRCPASLEDLDGTEDTDGCLDPDDDADGILDVEDACPKERGVASKSKKFAGCPPKDSDGDGLLDDVDRCPLRPEDLDGRHDQDGCPDPDDDADQILDTQDDCPTQRGPARSVAGLNGCPDPDTDLDTLFGTVGDGLGATELFGAETAPVGTPRDACPDDAEDYDGDRDEDGCVDVDSPKKPTKPLVTIELAGSVGSVRFARTPQWQSAVSDQLAAKDVVLLRALAKELKSHRDFLVQIAVRPQDAQPKALELAAARGSRLLAQIKRLTLRENLGNVVDIKSLDGTPHEGKPPILIVVRMVHRSGPGTSTATQSPARPSTPPQATPPGLPGSGQATPSRPEPASVQVPSTPGTLPTVAPTPEGVPSEAAPNPHDTESTPAKAP